MTGILHHPPPLALDLANLPRVGRKAFQSQADGMCIWVEPIADSDGFYIWSTITEANRTPGALTWPHLAVGTIEYAYLVEGILMVSRYWLRRNADDYPPWGKLGCSWIRYGDQPYNPATLLEFGPPTPPGHPPRTIWVRSDELEVFLNAFSHMVYVAMYGEEDMADGHTLVFGSDSIDWLSHAKEVLSAA